MLGTIIFFNSPRAFGFIKTGDDSYFFHMSNFKPESKHLMALGAIVEFEIGPPLALGKKPQAVNISVIDSGLAALSGVKP